MTKVINEENWLEPDSTLVNFVQMSAIGTPEAISGQEWAAVMLRPQMSRNVPREVARLFDGARGALVYGYFYYALCIMGMVALIRVAEAAVAYKCAQADGTNAGFESNIKWLASQGIVRASEWDKILDARSFATHPSVEVMILTLEEVAERVNGLFAS